MAVSQVAFLNNGNVNGVISSSTALFLRDRLEREQVEPKINLRSSPHVLIQFFAWRLEEDMIYVDCVMNADRIGSECVLL